MEEAAAEEPGCNIQAQEGCRRDQVLGAGEEGRCEPRRDSRRSCCGGGSRRRKMHASAPPSVGPRSSSLSPRPAARSGGSAASARQRPSDPAPARSYDDDGAGEEEEEYIYDDSGVVSRLACALLRSSGRPRLAAALLRHADVQLLSVGEQACADLMARAEMQELLLRQAAWAMVPCDRPAAQRRRQSRFRDSVSAIRPGLPLFLCILVAVRLGRTNIDPTAWEECPGESRSELAAAAGIVWGIFSWNLSSTWWDP